MSKRLVLIGWDDVPHLSQATKDEYAANIQPYQRDARMKGIPTLGSGAVYPFSRSDIEIADIPIPDHWRRGWALDTALSGVTAALWGALDVESQTVYITSEYKRSQAETAVHVAAIKARGAWMPGVGDAAAVADADRTQFVQLYREAGLDLTIADKAVEAGIQDVYDRFSSGRLKVFKSCQQFWEEFGLYRRDEKGRVVKQRDHLMDCARYLIRSGLSRFKTPPAKQKAVLRDQAYRGRQSWMGA